MEPKKTGFKENHSLKGLYYLIKHLTVSDRRNYQYKGLSEEQHRNQRGCSRASESNSYKFCLFFFKDTKGPDHKGLKVTQGLCSHSKWDGKAEEGGV